MEVTVIKHHIQFLMQHLYLLQNLPRSRPPYIIHHVLIDNLQISPDRDVEIHSTAVFLDVVPSESIDDVCERSAHSQQIYQLVHPHLTLNRIFSVKDVDLGDCPFLQEQLVRQQQFLLQNEVQFTSRLPFQIVDQLSHYLFLLYALQQHAVDQDEDFEHMRDCLFGGEHFRKIDIVLGNF